MSSTSSEEKVEIQNIEDQEIQQNEPVNSITPRYEADMIGNPWNTGLFDCHENETNAAMTLFLPCLTFGQIAEVVDGGEQSKPPDTLSCGELHLPMDDGSIVLSLGYRVKLQNKVKEEEFRELQSRDHDPALGWNGILAKQHARQQDDQTLKKPPSNQVMSK
uniref:Uncharacterized protein n=1 Tax=Lupinus angustifolius TaxID=3871 RepID=A0A182BFA5_LUPAN|nr:putative protein plant cadmium resistance 8 [Lupinus angustifolius]